MIPSIKIVECPRDAMQGITDFIPTKLKIEYLQTLLKAGFEVIDIGSFVSPKAVPQMQDTAEVLSSLDLSETESSLLVIVANQRGAVDACSFKQVAYLGYPLSVSETFQQRNTNRSIATAIDDVKEIAAIAQGEGKELVVYLSMAFGNPYGDPFDPNTLSDWMYTLEKSGIKTISLSDTVGIATEEEIYNVLTKQVTTFTDLEIGAHLHSTYDLSEQKVKAVFESGVRRIDGAILGLGGCPMATDRLTGNIPTEVIIKCAEMNGVEHNIQLTKFNEAMALASHVFQTH